MYNYSNRSVYNTPPSVTCKTATAVLDGTGTQPSVTGMSITPVLITAVQ